MHGKCVGVDSEVDSRWGHSQLRHRVPYTMFFFGFGLSYWNITLKNRSPKTTFHSHLFAFVCSVWPAAAGEPVWRGGSGRSPAEPPVQTGGGYPHPRAALRAAQLPSRPLRPSWPWLQLPDHQWAVRQYWLVNNMPLQNKFSEISSLGFIKAIPIYTSKT